MSSAFGAGVVFTDGERAGFEGAVVETAGGSEVGANMAGGHVAGDLDVLDVLLEVMSWVALLLVLLARRAASSLARYRCSETTSYQTAKDVSASWSCISHFVRSQQSVGHSTCLLHSCCTMTK